MYAKPQSKGEVSGAYFKGSCYPEAVEFSIAVSLLGQSQSPNWEGEGL